MGPRMIGRGDRNSAMMAGMSPRYLPLSHDPGTWTLLTCPRHTARDIEVRSYKEGHGTLHEVRCRLCGRDGEYHAGLPKVPAKPKPRARG